MTADFLRTARMSAAAAILFASLLSPASALAAGFLGVSVQAVEDAIAEALALAPGRGVLVASVLDDSPAGSARIKVGDVIVEVEKAAVTSPGEFRELIRKYEPGRSVDLRILRNQKYINVAAVLGEPPKTSGKLEKKSARAHGFEKMKKAAARPWIGVELQDLEDNSLASYFGVGSNEGSLVTRVHDESPAKKAGLESGDVIVKFADEEVGEGADLIRAVRDRKAGDQVEIAFMRKGKLQTAKLTLEQRPMDVSMNAPGMPRMHPRAPMAPHAPFFQKKNGKSRGAIDELREELEELRRELKELRDES
ncbi:MAG: PDZ domain-containing protein [Gemmatimonadetes bacterium]|nr:PDZ domain-containing protein [Gemmatimonadota bacterium]